MSRKLTGTACAYNATQTAAAGTAQAFYTGLSATVTKILVAKNTVLASEERGCYQCLTSLKDAAREDGTLDRDFSDPSKQQFTISQYGQRWASAGRSVHMRPGSIVSTNANGFTDAASPNQAFYFVKSESANGQQSIGYSQKNLADKTVSETVAMETSTAASSSPFDASALSGISIIQSSSSAAAQPIENLLALGRSTWASLSVSSSQPGWVIYDMGTSKSIEGFKWTAKAAATEDKRKTDRAEQFVISCSDELYSLGYRKIISDKTCQGGVPQSPEAVDQGQTPIAGCAKAARKALNGLASASTSPLGSTAGHFTWDGSVCQYCPPSFVLNDATQQTPAAGTSIYELRADST